MPVPLAVDHEVVAGGAVVLLELDDAAAGGHERRAAGGEHVLALVAAAAAERAAPARRSVRAADRELVARGTWSCGRVRRAGCGACGADRAHAGGVDGR